MRKVLRWGWIPVLVAFAYSGWVMYSRNADNRRLDAENERSRAKQDAAIVEKIGDKLKIVAFYASPAVIAPGGRGLLCYGVVNATAVRMEPTVPDVGPALSRCVETKPSQTTTYTLIAEDGQGHEERSTATIGVQ